MPDIDFLANKKLDDDQKSKKNDDKKEEIFWSEPAKNKPIPGGTGFFPLLFLGKKKEIKVPVVEPRPKIEPKPMIDKNKIREARQEILNLIKRHESLKPEKKQPTGKGLLASLLAKFKRQPSRKEILIDYQQAFSHEKAKRNLPAAQASLPVRPAVFDLKAQTRREAPIKPVVPAGPEPIKQANIRPVKVEKPKTVKPKPEFRDSFWGKLFKWIKDEMSALSRPTGQAGRPKTKPAKINLTAIVKETRPKIVEAPQPQPLANDKREIKIKEKLLEQIEPFQIDKAVPRVLATNLLKGEIITFFDWRKKIIILINVVLIPVFLISLIYLGLMYYQKQSQARIQEQTKKYNELTEKIKQAELGLKEVTEFQARLKIVSQIFAQHIYWTNFFKFLEDNTIKEVYYTGFSGDTSGNYSLGVIASSFSNIPEQFDILKNNQKITDVKTDGGELVSGGAGQGAGVKFNLDFSILKSIFTE